MLRVSPLEPAWSQLHFGFTTRDSGAAIPAASVCKGRPGSPRPLTQRQEPGATPSPRQPPLLPKSRVQSSFPAPERVLCQNTAPPHAERGRAKRRATIKVISSLSAQPEKPRAGPATLSNEHRKDLWGSSWPARPPGGLYRLPLDPRGRGDFTSPSTLRVQLGWPQCHWRWRDGCAVRGHPTGGSLVTSPQGTGPGGHCQGRPRPLRPSSCCTPAPQVLLRFHPLGINGCKPRCFRPRWGWAKLPPKPPQFSFFFFL